MFRLCRGSIPGSETSLPQPLCGWLSAGWRDFKIQPAASISYGVLVFLVSVVTVVGLFALRLDYILFPAFAGFMVAGPVIGIGLYEKSRRIEEGRPVSLWNMIFVKPESGGQILFAGVLLFLLTLLWMRAAVILYALFFGLRPFPGLDRIVPMLFTTEIGWAMLVVGGAVGGLFAAFAFAISAFSIPMLLSERTDALTAMGTSMALVWNNLPVMLTWAAIMLALIFVGIDHGPFGNDRRFPGAGTRKLARLSNHAVLSSTRGVWSFSDGLLRSGSGIGVAAAGCARSRRGSSAREPHRSRRRAADRSVGAHDSLRRMHPDDRKGARRACRRGKRARQSFDQARDRPMARRQRSAAFYRNAQAGRLRGPFVRHRVGQEGRRAVGTDTRARRRGIRREQYHAAFGVDLVGRRIRDPRSVSLAVCDHRAARAGLFRPDIFPFGMAGPEAPAHQYGRADLARRAARLRHEPLRDQCSMARTPISMPRFRCCSFC